MNTNAIAADAMVQRRRKELHDFNAGRCQPKIGIGEERLVVQLATGAVICNQTFSAAAVNVATEGASILKGGEPVAPQNVVVCRRKVAEGSLLSQARRFAGTAISVVDAGEDFNSLIHCGGDRVYPTVPKSCCRPHSPCVDAGVGCGNCCNNKKK